MRVCVCVCVCVTVCVCVVCIKLCMTCVCMHSDAHECALRVCVVHHSIFPLGTEQYVEQYA